MTALELIETLLERAAKGDDLTKRVVVLDDGKFATVKRACAAVDFQGGKPEELIFLDIISDEEWNEGLDLDDEEDEG